MLGGALTLRSHLRPVRCSLVVVVLAVSVTMLASAHPGGASTAPATADPTCSANYAFGPYVAPRSLRFGIDPELAGSIGSTQGEVKPVSGAKTLNALRALRPRGKELVLRINRLFESDGEAGIRKFKQTIDRFTRAGFDTELQVRYHPSALQAGDIAQWTRYVRHVVDVFGSNRHLLAMTITNEINLDISANTSDGYYPRAEDALVQGIIAGHQEAKRRGFTQLRFGFTFAYRFNPKMDAAVFTGLKRGGNAFRQALGFLGVDFYPELFPGRATPIPAATLQMMGTMRRCYLPLGDLGAQVPLWITESGYDTTPGKVTQARQRTALQQIVNTIHSAARTFGVTDYRWFNLRDNLSTTPAFGETAGLLTDSYARKSAFAAYESLIQRFGQRQRASRSPRGRGRAHARSGR